MKTQVWKIAIIGLLVIGSYQIAHAFDAPPAAPSLLAQTGSIQTPYIIQFAIDPATPLTVSQVEDAQTQATLTWQTAGMTDAYQLALESFRVNEWESLLQAPPASGSQAITIEHPANFGPPTYRLVIRDSSGNAVDERYLVVPYQASDLPPQVIIFTADVTNLSEEQLQQGTARIPVAWEVVNRPPGTNLLFEQIRQDGTAISIEPPRSFAWVGSRGQGEVIPVMPEGEAFLRLRIRLVNAADLFTIHERNLTIPIGEAITDLPTIHTFTAEPETIERGGQVTISWSVTGAEVVLVGQVDPDGAFIRPTEAIPANGSQTFTSLPFDFYTSNYFIYAGDQQGNGITSTTTVTVTCPYIYFFGPLPEMTDTCPLSEVTEVQAAHQLYERGEMIWRSDRQEITALYNDGTYERFEDTYQEDEEIDYPADLDEPPAVDALPIRGFGKVWANNDSTRENLGWASGHEIAYTFTTQAIADGRLGQAFSIEYLTLPTGQLIGLYPDGTWQVIEIAAP